MQRAHKLWQITECLGCGVKLPLCMPETKAEIHFFLGAHAHPSWPGDSSGQCVRQMSLSTGRTVALIASVCAPLIWLEMQRVITTEMCAWCLVVQWSFIRLTSCQFNASTRPENCSTKVATLGRCWSSGAWELGSWKPSSHLDGQPTVQKDFRAARKRGVQNPAAQHSELDELVTWSWASRDTKNEPVQHHNTEHVLDNEEPNLRPLAQVGNDEKLIHYQN